MTHQTESTFSDRHIGPRAGDAEQMLKVLGYPSLDKLVDVAVPASIRIDEGLDLPSALSESEPTRRTSRRFPRDGWRRC